MLEKLAWLILARQQRRYISKGKYHQADHIQASIETRLAKGCVLCCTLENTDWLAWSTRFASGDQFAYYQRVLDDESGS
jgi:hypothetical protein